MSQKFLFTIVSFITLLCGSVLGLSPDDFSWTSKISPEHPRLYLNADIVNKIRNDVSIPGNKQNKYNEIKTTADRWVTNLNNPTYYKKAYFDHYGKKPFIQSDFFGADPYVFPGKSLLTGQEPSSKYFEDAWKCAFLYQVTKNNDYFEAAKTLLMSNVCYLTWRHSPAQNTSKIDHYNIIQKQALIAFDWIAEDLSETEKSRILQPLLNHVEIIQCNEIKEKIGVVGNKSGWKNHENAKSGKSSGLYSTESNLWHAGIVAYNEGAHSNRAYKMLTIGYSEYVNMLNHRETYSGNGFSQSEIGYGAGPYHWCSFDFFSIWNSALKESIHHNYMHLLNLPEWISYHMIDDDPTDRMLRTYGFSDRPHGENVLGWGGDFSHMYANFLRIDHFYQNMPQYEKIKPISLFIKNYLLKTNGSSLNSMPNFGGRDFFVFLMDDDKTTVTTVPNTLEEFKLFHTTGRVFMRSGNELDDTYFAMNVGKDGYCLHKHYDEGSFVIYKKGFLALDAGDRGNGHDHQHLYYRQTSAHNSVLIHNRYPEDKAPNHTHYSIKNDAMKPYDKMNGGMIQNYGAKLLHHKTSDDYSYVATDLTRCYYKDADREDVRVTRQAFYVSDDYFIIYDQVDAKDGSQSKTWMLHTQNEPQIDFATNSFKVDENEGRLFCRTILPENGSISSIGGPGREFMSAGVNWEMREDTGSAVKGTLTEDAIPLKNPYTGKYAGQWKVEVGAAPGQMTKRLDFMHLIEVSDQSVASMVSTSNISKPGYKGVRFTPNRGRHQGHDIEVYFKLDGCGGEVKISDGGNTLINEHFNEIFSEDFENGWNGWSFYVDNAASASAYITYDTRTNKALHAYISDLGTETWHVHARKGEVALKRGKKYTVTFDARAEYGNTRDIVVKIEEDGNDWTDYSKSSPITINSTMNTYSYTFEMTDPTDLNAAICVEMGKINGSIPVDVVIDNIIVEEY